MDVIFRLKPLNSFFCSDDLILFVNASIQTISIGSQIACSIVRKSPARLKKQKVLPPA